MRITTFIHVIYRRCKKVRKTFIYDSLFLHPFEKIVIFFFSFQLTIINRAARIKREITYTIKNIQSLFFFTFFLILSRYFVPTSTVFLDYYFYSQFTVRISHDIFCFFPFFFIFYFTFCYASTQVQRNRIPSRESMSLIILFKIGRAYNNFKDCNHFRI